jgi:hypothetical protein
MTKRQEVIALLALGWSSQRMERDTQVRRETVSRYARSADPNPAEVFPGSSLPPRSAAWRYEATIRGRPARV